MMIDGRTILGRISPDDLAGRDAALDRLTAHATGTGRLDVISAPYAGRSEVLRQAYDLIFAAGGSTMPFYFRFKDGESIRQIAARFLHEFIAQATAFRLRRPELLRSAPDLCELRDAAATEDRDWIESLVNSPECGSRYDDKRAYVRAALSAPRTSASRTARPAPTSYAA